MNISVGIHKLGSLYQCFLTLHDFVPSLLPPRDSWQYLETVLVVQFGGRDVVLVVSCV